MATPETVQGQDMTAHGYAFLGAGLLACGAIYGLNVALAAWGAGGCIAVAFGAWLALRGKTPT